MNAPTRPPQETHTPYRFTYDEVLRMVEAGVLEERARVELIEGELIEVSPETLPHARARRWLTKFFMRALDPARWEVNPDAPAVLEAHSAPEPDIYIWPSAIADTELKGPDIVLAIEISVSSLRMDLKRKAPLYARYGVQEYWVWDVRRRRMFVHRDPTVDGYRSVTTVAPDGEVAATAFPELIIRIGDLPSSD